MQQSLPSNEIELLKSTIGKKIINVSRRLFEGDLRLKNYSKNYEQMADGKTELVCDNGEVVSFYPWTEISSVNVNNRKIEREGKCSVYRDLTNNLFWRKRVGQTIIEVTIIKSIYATKDNPMEFGVEFEFENGLKACIEYVNENEYVFDALIITEQNEDTRCTNFALNS